MSKIISFGNQKGGVGKSVLTTLCATILSQPPFDYKVCVIDCDKQKSLVEARNIDKDYHKGTFSYEVYDMSIPKLQQSIQTLDQTYHYIFIDAPGKLDKDLPIEQQEISKILMYLDYLFVPFKAGIFNLDATLVYLEFVQKIQQIRKESPRKMQVYGLVNMFRTRSRVNRYLIQEIEEIKSFAKIPFMRNKLKNYTLFEDIDTIKSLYNANAKGSAQVNLAVWFNEFYKIIKLS